MTIKSAVLVVLAALVPTVGAAQDVRTDFDEKFNFSTLKTYAGKIATGWGNPLSENRVLADLDEAMADKGWQKVPEAQANALIMLHGATQTKQNVNTFYSGSGGYRYRGFGTASTQVSEYLVGTLVVDIFDAKSKNLVFRGTATDELSKDPKRNEKKVDKALQKMFKDFPPKSGK